MSNTTTLRKIKVFVLSVILCLASAAQAQTVETLLDSTAYASVLTCGSGADFYTSFGHSAIRICDSAQHLDYVYNYGTFDFGIPHFYWRFALGNLNYCLSRTSFSRFLQEYEYEGRGVYEQRLRLSQQELNSLFILLETNHQPQFRYYRYDFFTDNCATRVRDMVNSCLDHRTLFVAHEVDSAMTYRQMLRSYTSRSTSGRWWQTGIDILTGASCDRRCNSMEYMFLPFNMMLQLDSTTIEPSRHAAATLRQPLAAPFAVVLDQHYRTPDTTSPLLSPQVIAVLFLVIVVILSVLGRIYRWRLAWLDVPLFALFGLLSLAIIFFWAFSAYACTKYNLNIFWASPLFLFFAFRPNSSPQWLIVVQLLLLLAAIILSLAGVQRLPFGVYAVITAVGLRLCSKIIDYRKLNKQQI